MKRSRFSEEQVAYALRQAELDDLGEIEQFTEPLKSAFPIFPDSAWLRGELQPEHVETSDFRCHYEHLEHLWAELLRRHRIEADRSIDPRFREGRALLPARSRYFIEQKFRMELRSQTSGAGMILRGIADAGKADLEGDDDALNLVLDLSRTLGGLKLCVRRNEAEKVDDISLEGDLLFDPNRTQIDEVEAIFRRTTEAAARLHLRLAPIEPDRRESADDEVQRGAPG
jgi:hypothetical protein